MSAILLQGITILPMTRPEDLLQKGDLLIRDGRIDYLGPCREWIEEDLEVFDGRGKVALPGLVNAHTHLAMIFLRGFADDMDLQSWLEEKIWPMETKLRDGDVRAFSLLGALELIASGITTFTDMYFRMEEVAQAVELAGLRAVLTQAMIVNGRPNAPGILRSGLEFACGYRGRANGRIQTMLAPHAVYTCPPEFLREVQVAAVAEQLGVHIHVSETRKEVADARAAWGKTPPQHLESLGLLEVPLLAIHCIWPEPEDYAILARAQGVVHCPVSNLKIAAGIAPVTELVSAGATVALGTDGACSNNRLELQQEIKTASLLAKVRTKNPQALPAFQVLQMATLGGARAIGQAGEIGTLEVDKQADIAIFDFNTPHLHPVYDYYSHLVYSALPSDVHSVLVQGRWLMRSRQYLTLDQKSILEEVKARLEDLLRR